MEHKNVNAVPETGPAPSDKELLRHVWRLAYPVLIQQALVYLVGLSDTLITGWYLSSDDVAAVTVATYISWFLSGLMAIVSSGATALVSRMVGAGDFREANRITGVALVLGLGIGLAVQVVGLLLATTVIYGINMTGDSAESAIIYFRVVVAAAPLISLRIIGMACMAGAGDTKTGSLVMLVVNVINVFLSWALVVGYQGLPKWGIGGVAAGTAIGECVGGVLVMMALAAGRGGLVLRKSSFDLTLDRVWRIVRISLPTVGETTSGIVGQIWYLALINRLGAISTAAHGVAIKCESVSYLMVGGFAYPAGILAGQYLGAQRPELARRATAMCWGLGMALLAVMGVILFHFNEEMFRLFLGAGKPELIDAGAPMLPVVAFAMPGLASINVLTAIFRGAGETKTPWFNNMIGMFLFRIPTTYLLAKPEDGSFWAWGLKGAWIAMLVDLNLRGLILAVQYFNGKWTKTQI